MTPAGDTELRRRAHAGHVAFLARATRSSGGELRERGGALACAPRHPFPFLNAVIAASEVADGAAGLDEAAAFYAARGRDEWSVFTRDGGEDAALERAAASRGLQVVNPNYPEMICTAPLEQPSVDAEVVLRQVHGDEQVSAYWELCRVAYATLGFPPEVFDGFERLLDAPVVGCLAWLGSTPVGGALVEVRDGDGIVFWVATAPDARGRGVGAAVTAWVTNRAFEQGAEVVSLQASPMGKAVYERIGYRDLFGYRVWRYASEAGQISR